jgi:hypothetical protein
VLRQQVRSQGARDRVSLEAISARQDLLAALPGYADPGPLFASTCYVWPTDDCSVGCAHCNFASPRTSRVFDRYRVADDVDRALELVNGMGLWKAVLSGGGEPMEEPEFCERFISGVDSAQLEEIELITSAAFATSMAETTRVLGTLRDAWRTRGPDKANAGFTVRISVDWFHAKRIGITPVANVLRALNTPEFAGIGCYLRSVLLDNDTTIRDLAAELGATLGAVEDYCQTMTLPDGRDVLVYYKNLILDGRMTSRRLRSLPVTLPKAATADVFGRRFQSPTGKHVPARVYNGPEVVHLDGLACVLEASGGIKILEGNHPHRFPSLRDTTSWAEALTFLYRDPLTVTLVRGGPDGLVELIADRYPHVRDASVTSNQLYYLSDQILDDPVVALLATVRAIEDHVRSGDLPPCAADLARRAHPVWERLHARRAAAR